MCVVFNATAHSQLVMAIIDSDKNTFGYLDFKFINPKGGSERFSVGYASPLNAKEFQVEIQDINLKKVNDVLLKFDAPVSKFLVSYNKSSILILGVPVILKGSLNNLSYFIYDLQTNKLSEKYRFSKDLNDNDVILSIDPIDDKGFIFNIVPPKKNSKIDLYAIDHQNKKMWVNNLTNSMNGKKVNLVFYDKGFSGNILGTTFSDDAQDLNKKYGLLLINKENGKEINRQLLDNSEFRYEPVNVCFKNNKILF